jgi:hypothetical protein
VKCAIGRAARTAALLPTLLGAACFQYVPILPAEAPVGKEVRLHLTDAGLARLRDTLGGQVPRLGKTIEGPLIASQGQRLLVGVPAWSRPESPRDGFQQRVSISVSDLLGVERKKLDKRKTSLIVTAAGVALGAFVVAHTSGVFGGTTGPYPEPGQGESLQVPIPFSR